MKVYSDTVNSDYHAEGYKLGHRFRSKIFMRWGEHEDCNVKSTYSLASKDVFLEPVVEDVGNILLSTCVDLSSHLKYNKVHIKSNSDTVPINYYTLFKSFYLVGLLSYTKARSSSHIYQDYLQTNLNLCVNNQLAKLKMVDELCACFQSVHA